MLIAVLMMGLLVPPGAMPVSLRPLAFEASPGAAATPKVTNDDADPATAVQSLLDRRASAVAAHDRGAFLKTIDPRAPASFRDAQALAFDGLVSVPLRSYRPQVRTDDSGDLAPGLGLAAKYGAQSAFLPETRQSYRLGEYDDRDAVDSLWWTYVQRDGEWFVAAEDDAAIIGLESARNLWDGGPIATEPTAHFLVMTEPNQTDRGSAVAGLAEQAMTTFQSRWSRPWSARIPVVIPGSPSETARLLRTTTDVGNFAAFVSYIALDDDGGYATTAPRVFSQESNLAAASNGSQVGTFVHELTHAATSAMTGPSTPIWAQEGLAEYVRRGMPTDLRPPTGVAVALPSAADFSSSDRATLDHAYALSTSAMSFLASIKGKDAPVALFADIGSRRTVPGTPAYNVDQSFRSVVGMSQADFIREWSAN